MSNKDKKKKKEIKKKIVLRLANQQQNSPHGLNAEPLLDCKDLLYRSRSTKPKQRKDYDHQTSWPNTSNKLYCGPPEKFLVYTINDYVIVIVLMAKHHRHQTLYINVINFSNSCAYETKLIFLICLVDSTEGVVSTMGRMFLMAEAVVQTNQTSNVCVVWILLGDRFQCT